MNPTYIRSAAVLATVVLAACQAPNAGTPGTPTGSASPTASMAPSAMPSMTASALPSMAPSTAPSMAPTASPAAMLSWFAGDMTGAAEVPAVTTPAGTGGAAVAKLSADGKSVMVEAWATGLTGDLTGAHVHMGAAGASGPVVKGLTVGADKRSAKGTWTMGDQEPLTAEHLAAMKAGTLYVNFHTAANPNGELRGQLQATGWAFLANLTGAAEVPPVTTTATGAGWLTLSADRKTARVQVYASGLSGDVTGAHVHRGTATESGPVVKGLEVGQDKRSASVTWMAGDGEGMLTPALIDDLVAGRLYVNVHTAANPNGEVRGQLMAP